MDLLNTVAHMDIFDLCDCLEDDSVDMILCDLPYGITACEWDNVIPFEPMWECFKRVIKPRGAVVLTASGKFTYKLVMSNFEWFKYEWVWDKVHSPGMQTAKYKPMPCHEIVLIFGHNSINYYPIMTKREKLKIKKYYTSSDSMPGIVGDNKRREYNKYYPKTIIKSSNARQHGKLHPTQKPVALFEYLIRTYTQPGEVVFDPCVGSGTTALAARNTGRNYICGDSSAEYVQVARDRLAKPYTIPMFDEQQTDRPKPEQMAMARANMAK
jgi:site-specific DNA-methyltransferase (adenine-specific)